MRRILHDSEYRHNFFAVIILIAMALSIVFLFYAGSIATCLEQMIDNFLKYGR